MRFLDTQHISAELGDVIDQAAQRLILVSPYLRFSENLKPRLVAAAKRVPVIMVYGKQEKLHTETERFLRGIPGCDVLFVKELHAKCVLNERAAVISSMNLYTYSQQNNWEMGVAFTQEEHPDQFQQLQAYVETMLKEVAVHKFKGRGGLFGKMVTAFATREASQPTAACACCGLAFDKKNNNPICRRCQDKIVGGTLPARDWKKLSKKLQANNKKLGRSFAAQIRAADEGPLCISCGGIFTPKQPGFLICSSCFFEDSAAKKPRKSSPPRRARPEHAGAFCIHCRKALPFNPDKPMCYDCFKTSSSKPARYCHHCGQEARTQLRQPVCGRCVELGYEVDETVVM